MAARRFLDDKAHLKLIHASEDFAPRKKTVPIFRIGIIFFILTCAVIILLNQLITKIFFIPLDAQIPYDQLAIYVIGIIASILVMGSLTIYLLRKVRHNITATEFQNLVFASCMRIDSEFCLVVHREKSGIYSDYNFSDIFLENKPYQDPFQTLLDYKFLPLEEKQKLLTAMEKNQSATVELEIKKGKESQTMKLQIDPIDRPKGFFLIRGHL